MFFAFFGLAVSAANPFLPYDKAFLLDQLEHLSL